MNPFQMPYKQIGSLPGSFEELVVSSQNLLTLLQSFNGRLLKASLSLFCAWQ